MQQRQRFQLGPPDWHPGTRGLLIATAACSLVLMALPPELVLFTALPSLSYPWTLLTSAVFEAGPIPFVITAIMLWMFGNQVEGRLGTRRFLQLYLGAAVVGNLATCLYSQAPGWIGSPVGAGYSIAALFVAFGHFHRSATILLLFLLPVNAWNMVFYGLGLDLLLLVLKGHPVYFGLFVAGLGALYFVTGGRNMTAGPLRDMELKARTAYERWKHKRRASHLTVIQGGKTGDDPWVRDEGEGEGEGEGGPRGPVIH